MNIKQISQIYKIILLILLSFVGISCSSPELPTYDALAQKAFPIENISFSYTTEYINEDQSIEKKTKDFFIFNLKNLSYKYISENDRTYDSYVERSYNSKDEIFELLFGDNFVIEKNAIVGSGSMPQVLWAWIHPQNKAWLKLPKQALSTAFQISENEEYVILDYTNSNYLFYFNKKTLNLEKSVCYAVHNDKKIPFQIYYLSNYVKVNGIDFPTSIKLENRDDFNDEKLQTSILYEIDKSSIKINDSFNENTSIAIPENAQVWDRRTDKRYIYDSKKATEDLNLISSLCNKVFPYENISFSYESERIDTKEGKKTFKNMQLKVDLASLSYLVIDTKKTGNQIERDYKSYSSKTDLYERLQEHEGKSAYSISLDINNGVAHFPGVLMGMITSQPLNWKILDSKEAGTYTLKQNDKYIILETNCYYDFYFNKKSLNLEKTENYSLVGDEKTINYTVYFEDYARIGNHQFPLSIKYKQVDSRTDVLNIYKIDKSSIKINNDYNTDMTIPIPEGTLITDDRTGERYIYKGKME